MSAADDRQPSGASASAASAAAGGNNPSDEEWERRFVSGDLPEDFLRVTEPKPEDRRGGGPEPALGNLVDIPGASAQTPAAATVAGGAAPPPAGVGGSDDKASPTKSKRTPVMTGVMVDGEEGEGGPPRHPAQSPMSTEDSDRALAMALQEQINLEEQEAAAADAASGGGFQYSSPQAVVQAPESMVGRLTVTVVEARLAKNYGFSRMDPYCRVRVGHSVYETPTCANGSKEPKWNKTFHCYLLQGVRQLGVEVYDECTFSTDPLIAHGSFEFPDAMLQGKEVVDIWFPLSGQEGAEKEGMLHVILSLQLIAPGQPLAVQPQVRAARNVAAGGKNMYYTTQQQPAAAGGQQQPQQQQQRAGEWANRECTFQQPITLCCSSTGQQPVPAQPPPKLSDEEIEEFVKMFPNLDREIILSVFEACRGNKEAMVNNLLQLGQQ